MKTHKKLIFFGFSPVHKKGVTAVWILKSESAHRNEPGAISSGLVRVWIL